MGAAEHIYDAEPLLCAFPRCEAPSTCEAGWGVTVHSCAKHAVVFDEVGGLAREELSEAAEHLAGTALRRLFGRP